MRFILIFLVAIKFVFPSCPRVLSSHILVLRPVPRTWEALNKYLLNWIFIIPFGLSDVLKKTSFPFFVSKDSTNIFFSLGLKTLGKHFPRSLQPISEIDKYPDSNCTITSYGLSWFSYVLLLMVHLSFHSRSRYRLIVLMAHFGHLPGSSLEICGLQRYLSEANSDKSKQHNKDAKCR